MSNFILINSVSALVVSVIFFLSLTISTFAFRYMRGQSVLKAFLKNLIPLSLSLGLLTISNHLALLAIAWMLSVFFLVRTIEHTNSSKSPEKQESLASLETKKNLTKSTLFLFLSLGIFIKFIGAWTITDLEMVALSSPGNWQYSLAGLFLLLASTISCGLFPFHRWILLSTESSTPACAFVHAVCAPIGIIALIRFHWLFADSQFLQSAIFIWTSLSVFLFGIKSLVRVDIKTTLAYSTLTQTAFMMLACSIGLYSVALSHFCLHAFFKAFQFLNAPSTLFQSKQPKTPSQTKKINSLIIGVAFLLLCMVILWIITRQSSINLGSELFLLLMGVLSGLEAGKNILNWNHLSLATRLLLTLSILILSPAIYAATIWLINHVLPIQTNPIFSSIHLIIVVTLVMVWFVFFCSKHYLHRKFYLKVLDHSFSSLSPSFKVMRKP